MLALLVDAFVVLRLIDVRAKEETDSVLKFAVLQFNVLEISQSINIE